MRKLKLIKRKIQQFKQQIENYFTDSAIYRREFERIDIWQP